VPKKEDGVDNTLVKVENWGGPWPKNSVFADNELYFEGKMKVDLNEATDIVFRNNKFFSNAIDLKGEKNLFQTSLPFSLKQLRRDALINKIQKPAQLAAQSVSPTAPLSARD